MEVRTEVDLISLGTAMDSCGSMVERSYAEADVAGSSPVMSRKGSPS